MIIRIDPTIILDFFNEKICQINSGCIANNVKIENNLIVIEYEDPYKAAAPNVSLLPIITRETLSDLIEYSKKDITYET